MEALIPTLKGKTILITGSTDGVGRMAARRLGEAGALVFIHGRDRQRGEETVSAIEAAGGEARFLQADLSSLDETRSLAAAVSQQTERLDVLINNAGIGSGASGAPRRTNAAGCELRFAVNYLAGFLLTSLLLPLLKGSAPARIVNVASAGQQALDFDDLMLTRGYSGARAYMQSKLAQILFTLDLARELEGPASPPFACIRRAIWRRPWCAKPASPRGAASKTAPRQSLTWRSRRRSRGAAASISTACERRAPMRKPMTCARANG